MSAILSSTCLHQLLQIEYESRTRSVHVNEPTWIFLMSWEFESKLLSLTSIPCHKQQDSSSQPKKTSSYPADSRTHLTYPRSFFGSSELLTLYLPIRQRNPSAKTMKDILWCFTEKWPEWYRWTEESVGWETNGWLDTWKGTWKFKRKLLYLGYFEHDLGLGFGLIPTFPSGVCVLRRIFHRGRVLGIVPSGWGASDFGWLCLSRRLSLSYSIVDPPDL